MLNNFLQILGIILELPFQLFLLGHILGNPQKTEHFALAAAHRRHCKHNLKRLPVFTDHFPFALIDAIFHDLHPDLGKRFVGRTS